MGVLRVDGAWNRMGLKEGQERTQLVLQRQEMMVAAPVATSPTALPRKALFGRRSNRFLKAPV
jgi:hypothetical protein